VKRFVFAIAIASMLALSGSARAHDAYDDSEANPLRLVAYALHPVGWALEWLVTRPIHFLASQPAIEPITGHVPHETPFGDYYPYRVHEDASGYTSGY
jgi:hypothetical protein